jgi:UDP-N-acetyl-D-mannosaminuronate dehydrogenase
MQASKLEPPHFLSIPQELYIFAARLLHGNPSGGARALKVQNILVIGLGEIGAPLLEIVRGVYHAEGLDIEPKQIRGPFDVLHICFPYNPDFAAIASDYINRFNPRLAIIESTVLPSTTNEIYQRTEKPICHSPVRGRKADGFKWAYFAYTKFIGPAKPEFGKLAEGYYQSLGFKTHVCNSPLETEFMKILNTTYYGLMITWFQEIHRICKKFHLREEEVIEFFRTNERDSGGKHLRPVFYPGVITGHCVIPNAELLQQLFPSPFVKVLLESNEKQKKEAE